MTRFTAFASPPSSTLWQPHERHRDPSTVNGGKVRLLILLSWTLGRKMKMCEKKKWDVVTNRPPVASIISYSDIEKRGSLLHSYTN